MFSQKRIAFASISLVIILSILGGSSESSAAEKWAELGKHL